MNIYAKNYKLYMLIPAVLFVAFFYLVLVSPGLTQGIDLKGGTMLVVRAEKQIDSQKLQELLEKEFDLVDLQVNTVSSALGYGANIQFSDSERFIALKQQLDQAESLVSSNPTQSMLASRQLLAELKDFVGQDYSNINDSKELLQLAKDAFLAAKDAFHTSIQKRISEEFGLGSGASFQKKDVAPVLGKVFWESATTVAIASAILVIIVVLFFFRQIVPSAAILLAALFDMLSALAGMALFKIPVSLASIPTVLMLVGYSIDTDILLTTRVLKRQDKTESERAMDSMKTGLTMTGTTISAVIAMMALSYLMQIDIMFQISFILFFGLIGDLISTWFMNAPMLLWFVEFQKRRKKQ